MNARLYDPQVGRFLSPDPYVQAPENIQNFNRYSYVLNNPLKYTDPTGEVWECRNCTWFGRRWNSIVSAANRIGSGIGSAASAVWGFLGSGTGADGGFTPPFISSSTWEDSGFGAGSFSGNGFDAGGFGGRGSGGKRFGCTDGAGGGGYPPPSTPVTALRIYDDTRMYASNGTTLNNAQYFIPVWGSVRMAEDNFNQGNYMSGVSYFLLANVEMLSFGFASKYVMATRTGTSATLMGRGANVAANITPKITRQMASRGWTKQSINSTVNNPHATRLATNRATGNPATAFYTKKGAYVVRDNITGEIIQISNRFDLKWIPDATIINPFIP